MNSYKVIVEEIKTMEIWTDARSIEEAEDIVRSMCNITARTRVFVEHINADVRSSGRLVGDEH